MISVAVKIEVHGFDELPDKLVQMEEFVNTATVLPLDETVTQQTIQLRRQHKKLKLGDAIIAATAVAYGLVLISRNVADFKDIEGLEVIDPHTL